MRVSEDEGGVEAEEEEGAPRPHHRAPAYTAEHYAQALAKYARTPINYLPEPPKEKKVSEMQMS